MLKKSFLFFMLLMLLCSCSAENPVFESNSENINNSVKIDALSRPSLLNGVDVTYDEEFTPQLQKYSINNNFDNIINPEDISSLTAESREKLFNNYFVVCESNSLKEFFNVYESNYYDSIPSFVTTDSAFHLFHLLYEYLQKRTEKNYLVGKILNMSSKLLNNSKEQLEKLRDSEWENAAQRNVDYFSVAVALCGGTEYVENENVKTELQYINDASGLYNSPIFTTEERPYTQDYTQFIVRGYYTETESLQRYFRVMMWYGQMTFTQISDELNKSALLLNLALTGDVLKDFECVYEVTSFFAGESDDNTYYEYYPIIEFYFGDDASIETVCDKKEEFEEYLKYIAELPKPQINSMYVNHGTENQDEVTAGFRLLGQRTSLDGIIMENLTYKEVEESQNGEARTLPTVLDVPAAFGSDLALNIINTTTDVEKWPTYATQMEKMRQSVAEEGNSQFSFSVSSAWLGSLSTLLEEKNEGWPVFMQSEAWNKKNLMTFIGGYTELKHDLILYGKASVTGKGGDGPLPKDDRGYVEPESVIYHRLSSILEATIDGLQSYNLISEKDISILNELREYYILFENVSKKELSNELPTDEEFNIIKRYGWFAEKVWAINAYEKAGAEYNEGASVEDYMYEEYPSFLVTDIATDMDNGLALQLGNERPMTIYVVVSFDNTIRIAKGATYGSTQFTIPISNRMTDIEWKSIVYTNNRDVIPPLPSWYEDVYVKNNNYSGTNWLGSENMSENAYSRLLTALYTVNIRDYPSTKTGNKVGKIIPNQKVEYMSYVKNEGYTWYQIGYSEWVADDGTWFDKSSNPSEDDKYINEFGEHAKQIEIKDTEMNIYSNRNTGGLTNENVHQGERYIVLSTLYDKKTGFTWYQIGLSKYVKDNGGDRVRIIG